MMQPYDKHDHEPFERHRVLIIIMVLRRGNELELVGEFVM